jgi:hypothetical protein
MAHNGKQKHPELHLPREMDLQAWKACTNHRKIPTREGPTFSDGGTPQQANFQSKKPTTYRELSGITLRRVSGERSGIQHSGLKCPSSSGSQFKTASSPGTISKKGVS